MRTVLYLLATQALIGAFDTIYYHEWRARLPALGVKASEELRLHAFRDFIYALMFGTLPWIAWQGWWAAVLVVFLLAEIFLTLKDFVVEDHVRKVLGGVYPGERVTHAIMGIVYGAMLAHLYPHLRIWWALDSGFRWSSTGVPIAVSWMLTFMAAGVFLSGVRDLAAAHGLPHSNWPWPAWKGSAAAGV